MKVRFMRKNPNWYVEGKRNIDPDGILLIKTDIECFEKFVSNEIDSLLVIYNKIMSLDLNNIIKNYHQDIMKYFNEFCDSYTKLLFDLNKINKFMNNIDISSINKQIEKIDVSNCDLLTKRKLEILIQTKSNFENSSNYSKLICEKLDKIKIILNDLFESMHMLNENSKISNVINTEIIDINLICSELDSVRDFESDLKKIGII